MKSLTKIIIIFLAWPSGASAVEYSSDIKVRLAGTYEDNARLSYENKINLYGSTATTEAGFEARENNWQIQSNLKLDFTKLNEDSYNSNDQYLTVGVGRQSERQDLKLSVITIRDSTRTSEIDTSGNIGLRAERRENLAITANWSYMVNDRSRVSLTASTSENEYKGSDYTGYKNFSSEGGWTYTIDETKSIALSLVYSDYVPDDRNIVVGQLGLNPETFYFTGVYQNTTESVGWLIKGEYSFTEKLVFYGNIGSTKSMAKYSFQEIPNPITGVDCSFYEDSDLPQSVCILENYESENLAGEVSLSYKGEKNTVTVDATVNNQPTNNGNVMRYFRASVHWENQLDKKNYISINLDAGENKAIDEKVSSGEREFATITAGYLHRITSEMDLKLQAMHRWQYREGQSGNVNSDGVTLSIMYAPEKNIW